MCLKLSAQVQSAESRNQLSLFFCNTFYDVVLAHNVKVMTTVNSEYKGFGSRRLWINCSNVTALTSSLRQTSKAVRQDNSMPWFCTFRMEIHSFNDTPSCPAFWVTWFKYGHFWKEKVKSYASRFCPYTVYRNYSYGVLKLIFFTEADIIPLAILPISLNQLICYINSKVYLPDFRSFKSPCGNTSDTLRGSLWENMELK